MPLPPPPPGGKEMCGDFKRGNCQRGDGCRFSHGSEGDAAAGQWAPTQTSWAGWQEPGAEGKGDGKGDGKGKDKGKDGKDKGKDGKDKGKGKKGKQQDWVCEKCACDNFGSRNDCFKCSAPKGTKKDDIVTDEMIRQAKLKSNAAPGVHGPPPNKFSDALWEDLRENTGLRLIGEDAIEGAKWNYLVNDNVRRSFAAVHTSPFSQEQTQGFFETVRDGTKWEQPINAQGNPIPRKTAWMVSKGCECTYKYGQIEVDPQEYPPWMLELMKVTMPIFGCHSVDQWPNSCNMNLYDDGAHAVGWHSDDEKIFNGKWQDIRILSLSLGQKRKFEIRVNYPEGDEGQKGGVKGVFLNSGDLMTMEGMFQKHYMHRVPKEERVAHEPRINLTWRWNVKHGPRCPALRQRGKGY